MQRGTPLVVAFPDVENGFQLLEVADKEDSNGGERATHRMEEAVEPRVHHRNLVHKEVSHLRHLLEQAFHRLSTTFLGVLPLPLESEDRTEDLL